MKLDFVPPRLAAAMSHPTRVRAMTILLERTASPREIADEIDERLNNVTYHLRQLRELGCIEQVRTERVHGGRVVEHFYRATARTYYFDDAAWEVLSDKERMDIVVTALRLVSEDIQVAMAAGTFFGFDNAHIARSPMVLDDEGWQEAIDVLTRATEELIEVGERVGERCAGGDPPTIHARVEMLQFRSPPPSSGDDEDAPAD